MSRIALPNRPFDPFLCVCREGGGRTRESERGWKVGGNGGREDEGRPTLSVCERESEGGREEGLFTSFCMRVCGGGR